MRSSPLLRQVEHFGPLTDDEKRVIEAAISRTVTYGPRQDIVRQGERPSDSCLIVKGFAYRYKELTDGRRQITAVHVPGDFCDLHSFLLKQMDDGVATFTDCEVARFPHARLREITRDHPYLTRVFWMTTLVDGAVHREWMLALGRLDALERVAHFFCEMFCRLQSIGMVGDHTYELPITQGDLADLFGLTIVHVNRTLAALRKDGLAEMKGKTVRILDWDGLCQTAEFDPGYLHANEKLERD